jgi:hypothetical protein
MTASKPFSQVKKDEPEVTVLLELRIPGITVLKRLKREHPAVNVSILLWS